MAVLLLTCASSCSSALLRILVSFSFLFPRDFLWCTWFLIVSFFFFLFPAGSCYFWDADIDKIYNSVTHEKSNLKKQRAILYEGPSAYFRRDLMVFKNFDPFRAGDIFTIMILAYAVAIYLMNLPTWFYVV